MVACREKVALSRVCFKQFSPMRNCDRKKRMAHKLEPFCREAAWEKATKARLGLSRNCKRQEREEL